MEAKQVKDEIQEQDWEPDSRRDWEWDQEPLADEAGTDRDRTGTSRDPDSRQDQEPDGWRDWEQDQEPDGRQGREQQYKQQHEHFLE